MKKTAAILLSIILLFNWAGYRLLVSYLRNEASVQLDTRLENQQYDESQLISVKVPAPHLSSYSLSGQFERTSGQVMIGGIQYQYVKKRLFNDSLEYVCIPNQKATQLLAAQNDFFGKVADLQTGGQPKKSGSFSGASNGFSIGYYITHDFFGMPDPGAAAPIKFNRYFTLLSSGFFPAAEQPPDVIA